MEAGEASPLNPLLRKLGTIAALTEEDRNTLRALPITIRTLQPDHDIAREGDRPTQCCIILEGWAFRSKLAGDGTRQIVAFHLPGDFPDLQSLYVPVMDHTLTTLTSVTAAVMTHQSVRELLARAPHLAAVFWRDTLIEAAVTREWIVNMSVRSAKERIAHLLCEMHERLQSIGLAQNVGGKPVFPWPVTQARLAETTGLSAVHVNRSLQELRAEGLLRLSHKWVTMLNGPGMRALAGFKPDYLSLRPADDESVAA